MPQENLKLTSRAALLASIAACFPIIAHSAPVARVDFAVGNVAAVSPNGQTRQITKGTSIDEGEMIATNNGRAQLRFTDGAYVSLQPQSEFRIDKYQYQGQQDGSEKGFFSLLKGGLRTITGLIGRSNKQNYQVNTAVATIGIRGTEYTIQYGSSITGTVGEGEIEVCNGAGCLNVTNGESYYVQNQDVKPQLTDKGTDLPPAPPDNPPADFKKGDNVGPDGFSGSFVLAGKQFLDYVEGSMCDGACIGAGSGEFEFDANGNLLSFGRVPVTAVQMGGNDGIMAWGTFVSASSSFGEISHFVAGTPVPSADLSSLAIGKVTGFYSLIGSTPVTNSANQVVGSLNGATLRVDFSGSLAAQASMSWTINGAPLSATLSGFAGPFVGGLSGSCGVNCSVNADAQVFGPNAIRAGMVYDINSNLIGAAAFAKQ